jgi:dipeptidyl-peptidase III
MNRIKLFIILIAVPVFLNAGIEKPNGEHPGGTAPSDTFQVAADRFADIQVLRYKVPGFDKLTLRQKELAYYLYQAGLSGRDIFYDQKYKYNLYIRKILENILQTYTGDRKSGDFTKFSTYCKQFFFANGIHHHYSNDKFTPEFSSAYFKSLIEQSKKEGFPSHPDFPGLDIHKNVESIMFDPSVDPKAVVFSPGVDVVKASSNNFYENVTQKEAETFYSAKTASGVPDQPSWGLNSKLVKENGNLVEKTWKMGGMYNDAIAKIVFWIRKAIEVAENEKQKQTLELLVKYYETGDLKTFDEYSISWVGDTSSTIDFANSFIETYLDPLHRKGSYESIVSMKDFEATKRIAAISREAQWFENHAPLMPEHRKKDVKGISAKVITVIGEVGDAAPSTPIGINLPNAEWIREKHGSKSVSLGNVVAANNLAKAKSPLIDEFGIDNEVKVRYKKYSALAGELHTDMHEVIGHASGIVNKGVGTTSETLKNYASTLEEARADLVALYFIMDKKLVEIGVMLSTDLGKAQYDGYLLNGLMTQLYRIKPGNNLEQAHMRNRQLNSAWVLDKGKRENVLELIKQDGKTYIKVNDYDKLRNLFGDLLREIQRIKSEGDYEAGKNLVETYGVKVDQDLLKEVHTRYEKIDLAPYTGFLQPVLVPVMSNGKITDVKVEYARDFISQMLDFGKNYSFLPLKN